MNPWFFPWWGLFKGPFSGDLTQDIAPVTSWFSPQFELNFAGNRRIEAEVVSDVASYGRQLGILSEAILELADGKKSAAIDKLKEVADQIAEVKHRHADRLEQRIRSDLDQLKQKDSKALKRLLKAYEGSL